MASKKCAQTTIRISKENKKELLKLLSYKQILTSQVESFDSIITDLLKLQEQLKYYYVSKIKI